MGKRRLPDKSLSEPIDSLLVRTVVEEIDLHGLDARGAEIRLEGLLARWTGRAGSVVRIITGRGNRSDGAAVLKPLVGRLLSGRFAAQVERYSVDSNGGAYLVEVRASR
jgi:DNA-nicking Smr family endonuclease